MSLLHKLIGYQPWRTERVGRSCWVEERHCRECGWTEQPPIGDYRFAIPRAVCPRDGTLLRQTPGMWKYHTEHRVVLWFFRENRIVFDKFYPKEDT